MEHHTDAARTTTPAPLMSFVIEHAGHRFHCTGERGLRSYTWIIRMNGETLRFVRTPRALEPEEVRNMIVWAYEATRGTVAAD